MEKIKTAISTIKSLWDRDDQWLPPGNYFFTVIKIKNKYIEGTVSGAHGFEGAFEFGIKDFIKMMAISQARLARKAGENMDEMPTYPSPPPSPRRHYPNNYVNKESEKINCAICFEEVKKKKDVDYSNTCLRCEHVFHRKCLIPWIRQKDTCPICRKKKKGAHGNRRRNSLSYEEELFPTSFQPPANRNADLLNIIRTRMNRGTNIIISHEESV